MCKSHKKALQPPHPSEPIVGQFIRNLPCQRCIPLYPLRYAISDRPIDCQAQPQLDIADYPPLKGPMHYGLRVLRPGTYVYLFYFKDGRMWTQHYQVTEDGRFAALWWNEQDHEDQTPGRHARPDVTGATAYLPAPESHIADTVWLQVSDTLLSHCMLWQIEQDSEALRSRLATPVKSAQGPGQAHTLPADQLQAQVAEMGLTQLQATQQLRASWTLFPASHPLHWSEHQHNPVPGSTIAAAMRAILMARTDIQPLAVVVHDPIGITSELNYQVTRAVQARTRFAADNAHKLTSAQLIGGYFQQNHPASMTEALARQKRLVNWAELQRFPASYAQRLAALETPIKVAVDDVANWLKGAGLIGFAFTCFDLEVLSNAEDFEEAVIQCTGALVHSEAGRKLLAVMVETPPARSLYWLAVAQANPDILARLEKPADLSKRAFEVLDKYLEEHAATPATNALIGLLQALPDAKKADVLVRRLRHVLEMRFNATLIEHNIGTAQYLRYVREFEGHQVLGPELLKRWGLNIDTTVTPGTAQVQMKFYEWVKVDETEYRVLDTPDAQRAALPSKPLVPLERNPLLRQVERLRGPMGHMFTGVGGVTAVLGMRQSYKDLKTSELETVIGITGATLTLIGASIEIGSTGISLTVKNRGNANLHNAAKVYAAKRGMAVFGAAGASLFALSDGVKAAKSLHDRNPQQAGMHVGATVAGGVLTLATWAGGIATAKTLIGGAGPVAFLGLTPAGWAVIALIAVGVGIVFALTADAAKHGPLEIWLKHSAWGQHPIHYNHQQELDAFYSLLYRPRLNAQWDKSFGSNVGRLDIDCALPSTMKGERFSWIIQVTLNQQLLTLIEGPIVHASDHSGIDYHRQYLIRRESVEGTGRSWKITMHEDAKVALEYLYHPNFNEQPDLAITQPNAPAPIIFTSGGWFSDPIDNELLAPVRPPE
ncbi:MAG: hypothetical protein RSD81_09200 [Pseudomonas sp.]